VSQVPVATPPRRPPVLAIRRFTAEEVEVEVEVKVEANDCGRRINRYVATIGTRVPLNKELINQKVSREKNRCCILWFWLSRGQEGLR
jgi:hypothetical protein